MTLKTNKSGEIKEDVPKPGEKTMAQTDIEDIVNSFSECSGANFCNHETSEKHFIISEEELSQALQSYGNKRAEEEREKIRQMVTHCLIHSSPTKRNEAMDKLMTYLNPDNHIDYQLESEEA